MKKLLVGVMAAICCCAFVAPAFAEVKVEGMIQNDFYYHNVSKENVIGGLVKGATTAQDDWSTTRINMPQPLNRLTVRYLGEDKVVNGYIQLRAGGSRANAGLNNTTTANSFIPSESGMSWEYAYIDWHVNPNLYFRFGRQDQTFAGAYAPNQAMGYNDGHIIGVGFGNITAATRDGVRAFIKFNDNIRMEVQLIDPNTEIGTSINGGTGALANNSEFAPTAKAGVAAARESNVIPRIDISLPMKFGNFTLEPGFTWMKQEWDQVLAGSDDSINIWGLTLGGSAGFGPFSIMAEVTWGKNLANGNYAGGTAGPGGAALYTVVNGGGVQRFEDGETLAWFVQLGFDFGPFAIQGIVGMNNAKNDGDPTLARDAAENDWTQWMYGLNFPIKVTKVFTITPAVWYYDYDSDAKVGALSAVNNVDRGNQLQVGVTFQLVF